MNPSVENVGDPDFLGTAFFEIRFFLVDFLDPKKTDFKNSGSPKNG